MIRAIFFDAAGTLFRLTQSVGENYALVGRGMGLALEAAALDAAFSHSWERLPPRPQNGVPRADDDKSWWRELVFDVLEQVAPQLHELDRDNFFEVAYEHFAEAGVWESYPETLETLERIAGRFHLAVLSNFDARLRLILEQLGLSKFFPGRVFLSSELGFDKPNPQIFRRACALLKLKPDECLHVGDDPERDWRAARAAGLRVFELRRPENSLRNLFAAACEDN